MTADTGLGATPPLAPNTPPGVVAPNTLSSQTGTTGLASPNATLTAPGGPTNSLNSAANRPCSSVSGATVSPSITC